MEDLEQDDKIQQKSPVASQEEQILNFWQKNKIFEKSLQKSAPKGNYVFYDGPPFATGLPHYGHILASTIKDAIPRYQTMKGFYVERRWGWDCHGLPIENIVEKDFGISGKKQIEEKGIAQFNEYARSKVLNYVQEWKKTIERIGRWVDFDGSYKTMDNSYIESVWWALKHINDKGLIYEGTRVLPYCPRCETPIANSEIAMDNSYRDITDISVYAKFELTDEPGTYLLAWTTTPWTLPGNFALAVNPDVEYVKVKDIIDGKTFHYILAKPLIEKLMKNFKSAPPEIVQEMKGMDLIGNSYKPIFNYFFTTDFKNKENAWKVYGASFVTTESGTGIVHIAPGYGEDDMNLAKENNIPFIHHVGIDGKFKEMVTDFKGLAVKPKGDHQSADILIIKYLAHAGMLFAKEKIIHSYPHCYRCDTPLYYYAIPAWFINIQKAKERILKLNDGIHWVPEHLKEGRFKKSAEAAPDWNISRNRYWASPLPIWRCKKCNKIEFFGSLKDIQEKVTHHNHYFVMRHGESESNLTSTLNVDNSTPNPLTKKGEEEVMVSINSFKDKNPAHIDAIYASPLSRTKQTAEIVAKSLGIDTSKIIYDERLTELKVGEFNGKTISEYWAYFKDDEEKITKVAPGGESILETKSRVASFLYAIESEHQGKNIFIITHQAPARMLFAAAEGANVIKCIDIIKNLAMKNAEIEELPFAPLPHNKDYELDLHRPYIDDMVFKCDCGGEVLRIPEVIDCWFESGSMPFAQVHYPFEKKDWFHDNFPSQFVTEYIAQTRTWFYYMLVVSTILFDNVPFENVVTTGTVLAEDGQKMSKSKGNFPDPWILFNKYGVDALRYYLLASPLMKSEDLNFTEKDVDGVFKKILLRLKNVVSFYELYKGNETANDISPVILDQWIISRLRNLSQEVDKGMREYEIDKAVRPFDAFIDDLSTWYLRRSRERFKGENEVDKKNAISTTRYILEELSKLIAPFMPFLAEEVYQKVKGENSKESVHLEKWPEHRLADNTLLKEMADVRKIVSLALEARAKVGIKVRQPLKALHISHESIGKNAALVDLIKDEVNIKEIKVKKNLNTEVELDIEITPELKAEGQTRDLIRMIQEFRKKEKLNPKDMISLTIDTDSYGKNLIEKYRNDIMRAALLNTITYESLIGDSYDIDGMVFKVAIRT